MESSGSTDDFVVVGRIGPAHGLRGEVFVEPRTDEPERRFAAGARLHAAAGPLTVAAARIHSGRLVVRFEELADRTAAEAARGTELTRRDRPGARAPEDPEEFYDHQLVGLRVETTAGELVGELDRIEHNAAQDLLVIRTPEREVLFPFVSALVPEVDVRGGRIVIDDRPGLLAGLLMRIDVVTIFPEYLAPLGLSLPGKAQESGLLDLHVHDLRDWTHDRHRTVDDTPYGGGAGMVMKPEPWGEALEAVAPADAVLVVPTPSGLRSPRPSRPSSPAASTWSSRAAATRASTSGWSTTRRRGWRSASSRSATTCSTAARSRRWR